MSSEHKITIEGMELSFRDSGGDGLPLLMLHGSGAGKVVFANQFESPLAGMFRLIALDLPGHGASDDATDPAATYSITGYARIAEGLLGSLGIRRAALFGWSLGGHVAIEMMKRSEPLLAGVMISGTPPIRRGPFFLLRGYHLRPSLLLSMKPEFDRRDAERYAALCYGDRTDETLIGHALRADGKVRSVFPSSMQEPAATDQKAVVESSAVPLAVVSGSDEPVVRLDYLSSLHYANLWERQCHLIPGGGHAPFLRAPYAFNTLLHRFMTALSVREQSPQADRTTMPETAVEDAVTEPAVSARVA